jgi:uncharacterized membrane protein YdbT with pleckstrin-like domain
MGTRFDFLEPDERALARFRPSSRLLVAEVTQQAFALVVTLGVAVLVFLYARDTGHPGLQEAAFFVIASFFGIEAIFIITRLIRTGLEIYYTEYVITDRRTYSITAIISRNLTSVPFEKVTNIGVRRNLFERIIHVDRVNLVAYGIKGTQIQMRGVEDTADVFRRLQHLTRAECSAENLLRAD